MKVVLLGEIKGKGGEGDVIDVAQGYAENYLIPQKLAVAATKGNLKQLEERRNNIEKREAVRLADALGAMPVMWTALPEHNTKQLEAENDAVIFQWYEPVEKYK